MGVLVEGSVNDILVSAIHSDDKLGTWWAIGTEKQWVEFRTTKTGLIRVGKPNKGTHPYFTIKPLNNTREE